MRAWTVDADDIRVAEDFDEFLLHQTPEIDSFLNLDRDDKFIVVGTKGFGKAQRTALAVARARSVVEVDSSRRVKDERRARAIRQQPRPTPQRRAPGATG